MKLPCLLQFRILKLALTSLFTRPFTTRFPKEPFTPIDQFRGRPRFHEDDCIGCGACVEVCPAECIDVVDDANPQGPTRTLIQHLDACILCGQCERYCITEKGILLSTEYDYVGFTPEDFEEKVEKELLLCECCGKIIAPVDQLRWLVKRLGPLAYANPTLMLVSQRELAVVSEPVTPAVEGVTRADRLTISCPHCRRKTALAI